MKDYYLLRMDIGDYYLGILFNFYPCWENSRLEYYNKLKPHNSRQYQALLF